jgi:hypothetical protein
MKDKYENMRVIDLRDILRNKGLKISGNKSELIQRLSIKAKMPKGKKEITKVPENVVNKSLYIKIREKVKKSVKVWPSAYASGLVVKEYKKAGGKYLQKTGTSKKSSDLKRWYNEKWINVCYYPKIVNCGRKKTEEKNYPYCRPLYKINSKTPTTVKEIINKYGKEKLKELCNKKRKDSKKRILLN